MGDLVRGETFAAGETVTAARLHKLVEDALLVAGSVDTAELADGAVTSAKLDASIAIQASSVALASGKMLVGNGSSVGEATTVDSATLVTSPSVGVKDAGIGATQLATDAVTTAKILAANVTYAKVQNVAASRLLGNATGSPAAPAEIALGDGLEFSGGLLQATGSAGLIFVEQSVGMPSPADPGESNNATLHDFTQRPALAGVTLRCIADDGGYLADDDLPLAAVGGDPNGSEDQTQPFGASTRWDGDLGVLTCYVILSSPAATLYAARRDTGVSFALDLSKWAVRFSLLGV